MDKDAIKKALKLSLRFLPDKLYVRLYFRLNLHRSLNRKDPQYLNDKLQWMKFNCRSPLQTVVSDKYAVRQYVADRIGAEYLIPLAGVWDRFEDIDRDTLPDQFVLKCNHDSGGLSICRSKQDFDWAAAEKKIRRCLRQNFYAVGREYQYRNIVPRILCEEFISEDGNVPADYKIYCFNGKPDVMLVCLGRFGKNSHKAQYYYFDRDWNFLPLNHGDRADAPPRIDPPENMEEMFRLAGELSRDFIFARIDLYNIHGKIYFGEITLSPNSGFDPDITIEADRRFGELLQIPHWSEIRHHI